tara:strand:+ start:2974 stop:4137 length:1164 start_codon:yes stop_codon:yes gene_type:complete
MEDKFAHMRPFAKEEVPAAVRTFLNALDWKAQLSPFLGEADSAELIDGISSIESVEEFQSRVSKPFVQKVLDITADEVTFSFPESFDSHGALLISNHRDIVLDPSLINMGLLSLDHPTTQIGIGSNLLETSWVEALVRLNKSFIVSRGGTPREQLMSSAEVASYARHVILNQRSSLWLAHREGRAKDGNDRTSPALIRMLVNQKDGDDWNAMRVHPVSLSYEWDPCDGMKVRELLLQELNDGSYEKKAGEDERSMKQGLFGFKGSVHVAFCEPLNWKAPPEGMRPAVHMANLMDQSIHAAMKEWPAQHWAASQLLEATNALPVQWPTDWRPDEVSNEISERCEKRLKSIVGSMRDLPFSTEQIRMKWCQITATPLLNHACAVEEAVA